MFKKHRIPNLVAKRKIQTGIAKREIKTELEMHYEEQQQTHEERKLKAERWEQFLFSNQFAEALGGFYLID